MRLQYTTFGFPGNHVTLNLPSPLPLLAADEALLRPHGQTQDFRVAQPGTFAAGSRFGAYTIRSCIGEGGMARVYSAEHAGLKRPVALKVLIEGHKSEDNAHQRFLREACLAAAIKHHFILKDDVLRRMLPFTKA